MTPRKATIRSSATSGSSATGSARSASVSVSRMPIRLVVSRTSSVSPRSSAGTSSTSQVNTSSVRRKTSTRANGSGSPPVSTSTSMSEASIWPRRSARPLHTAGASADTPNMASVEQRIMLAITGVFPNRSTASSSSRSTTPVSNLASRKGIRSSAVTPSSRHSGSSGSASGSTASDWPMPSPTTWSTRSQSLRAATARPAWSGRGPFLVRVTTSVGSSSTNSRSATHPRSSSDRPPRMGVAAATSDTKPLRATFDETVVVDTSNSKVVGIVVTGSELSAADAGASSASAPGEPQAENISTAPRKRPASADRVLVIIKGIFWFVAALSKATVAERPAGPVGQASARPKASCKVRTASST